MSAQLELPAFSLRPIRPVDLPEILAIELASYEYSWTEGIFADCLRAGYACWLIEQFGTITAYCLMSVAAGEAHILNLCVQPGMRRQGVANTLMGHMLELARRRGANTALLEVRPSNHAAITLYRMLGFSEIGTRRDYYPTHDGREDALVLAKTL